MKTSHLLWCAAAAAGAFLLLRGRRAGLFAGTPGTRADAMLLPKPAAGLVLPPASPVPAVQGAAGAPVQPVVAPPVGTRLNPGLFVDGGPAPYVTPARTAPALAYVKPIAPAPGVPLSRVAELAPGEKGGGGGIVMRRNLELLA